MRMRFSRFRAGARAVALAALVPLFVSCVSTRVYVRTTDRTYEDGALVAESYRETRDGTELHTVRTTYRTLPETVALGADGIPLRNVPGEGPQPEPAAPEVQATHSLVAGRTSDSKKKRDVLRVSVVETKTVAADDGSQNVVRAVVGTKTCRLTAKGALPRGGKKSAFKGDAFAPWDEALFTESLGESLGSVLSADNAEIVEAAGKAYRTEETVEEITVRSTPNGWYILYQVAGKPFVLAGCTFWNLVKCAGYALYNFSGGYHFVTGSGTIWKTPSWSTAKDRFSEAREENRIEYYPEYHLPFTNNEITVRAIDQETAAAYLSRESAVVTRETTFHVDNQLSVQRSAAADAAYTAGIVGLIGTGVTIPVSVITWGGGALVGLYVEATQ